MFYSHVASESVQVVVGLLTFNYAVVLQRVEITILQTDNKQLIIEAAAATLNHRRTVCC